MYRFLLRPRWILSHLVVLALIVAMILAMFWQIRRLDEKKERNALITARADVPAIPVDEALRRAKVTTPSQGEAVDYRAAWVEGEYRPAEEFTIPSRTLNGAPGRLVVTPLRPTGGGDDVLVLRGFVPQAVDDTKAPIDGVEPPSGNVRVRGWLRASEEPTGFFQSKEVDVGDGNYARIDIARLERARRSTFAPAYLLLGRQTPPTKADSLSLYPLPERSEGPHFSYAVQWGVFTLIAVVGYPLVIRRVARGGSKQRDDVPTEPDPTPDPEPDPDPDPEPAGT